MTTRELLIGLVFIGLIAGAFMLGKASASCDPQVDFVVNG